MTLCVCVYVCVCVCVAVLLFCRVSECVRARVLHDTVFVWQEHIHHNGTWADVACEMGECGMNHKEFIKHAKVTPVSLANYETSYT